MNKDTMVKDRMVYEDEIDLRELFKTIAKSKVFIIVFTSIVTIMAIIYAYSKTPIYEVKSVIKIGYIASVDKDGKSNKVFLENAKVLQEKLKLIYNVGANKNSILKNKAIVSNVKIIKGTNDFLEIYTQGLNNELAINKAKEVVSFVQNSYKNKIEYIKIKKNIEIKNLENQINYLKDVENKKYQREILKIKNQQIPQIDQKIELVKNQQIPQIDQKIKTIKKQQIPQIDQKIELVKNQQIPKITREIKLLKEVDLKNLENKIKFNKSKINKYEKMISEILKERTKSSTNNMIMSIQLFNMQNLILNLNKDNENLKKEKEYLLNIKLKDLYNQKDNILKVNLVNLYNQKDNILKVNLVNLYNQKDNILKVNLVNLYNQKDNIIKDKIQSIKNKLKHELPKKILNLENKIRLTKMYLNNEIKNTTLVGDMLVNDYPVKPKKRLIVAVAFVTSLILSIFLVFLMNFIKGIKED